MSANGQQPTSADILSLRLQFMNHESEMMHEGNACLDHVKCNSRHIDHGDRSGDDRQRVGQQYDAKRES